MSDHAVGEVVESARRAAGRGEWRKAFELLTAPETGRLDGPAELSLLGQVAYAAGELDVAIEAWERAYARSLQAGDRVAAAEAALRVAFHLLLDGALMAPVRAWSRNAEQLLEDQQKSAAHAWLAVVRAYERLLTGDLDAARGWAERAVEVGARHDPAAHAIGRVAQARLLILSGEVHEGLALLDEVGVATVAGGLDAVSTGIVYCELVCALQGIAQYDAAEEWTEAMERWSTTSAVGSLHGRCRVHRAEILRLRGAYAEAEGEAIAACDELRPYLRRELGWPLSELGLIRLRRGDVDGAEEALLAAHRLGWDPQPGLALVQLVRGELDAASASIREALEHPANVPSKERPPDAGLQRVPLLEAQVEIELVAGDVEQAASAAEELERVAARFHSRALVATATLARARVRFAESRVADAERLFADAVRLWNEIDAPYEVAVARRGLAHALRAGGRVQQAELELQAADRLLAELRDGGVREPDEDLAAAPGFSREDDYWSLMFEGHTVRIRDLKGIRYLALLVESPGHEFHVLDLVAADNGTPPPAGGPTTGPSRRAIGDAGELLDQRAKDAYRRRLVEIEDDIDRARALGDDRRAAQADLERDFLARELARAVGLGGRDRRAASATERARVAVTRAIRHAIGQVRVRDAELGAHLDRTVRTGIYCTYLPDGAGGLLSGSTSRAAAHSGLTGKA